MIAAPSPPPSRPAPVLPAIRPAWIAGMLVAALLAALAGGDARAQARRVQFDDAPVRDVVAAVEEATGYRFLYRDALVTGKTVSFAAAPGDLLAAFDAALRPHGLALRVDAARRQVLVTRVTAARAEPPAFVTGYVLDAGDGARLPFATVTWTDGGRLSGVTANEAGAFQVPLDGLAALDTLRLTASYVGYRPETVRVDVRRPPAELSIRLLPVDRLAQEVVVTGTILHTDLDTTFQGLVRPGVLATFGEASVMRSLQVLPSVALAPALSQGLNVRGSRSDGFQVLLDGMPVYSQTHLFGLFDAFNEEALQTVGFFYGVTPARYQGPPGGTLSFVTRTGSQAGRAASVGASNTAVRGTFEGPLFGGRGSWLASARHSYLGALGWFNNDALVAQGLDVGRRTSVPGIRTDSTLAVWPPEARFYDVHGKLYREGDGGQRWTLNAYAGGDRTYQAAERFVQAPDPPGEDGPREPRLERVTAETRQDWGSEALGFQAQQPVGAAGYSQVLLGFSRYHSDYAKDDFTYRRPAEGGARQPPALLPFANTNRLVEWRLAHQVDLTRAGAAFSTGYTLHHFSVTYAEQSALRSDYAATWQSLQFDFFAEYQAEPLRALSVEAGLRSHYFSTGSFLRLSPRLQARLWPRRRVSFGLGASRNHQFLHRLYLPHGTSTDVWVMSTRGQPPASVDNATAAVYVKVSPGVFVQAEGYVKAYRNQRQHESGVLHRRDGPASVLLAPWLHDNRALARGLEVMVRTRLGPVLWTNGYTLSRVEIRNPALDGGRPFRAEWDRTHQLTSFVEAALPGGLTVHLLWLFGTGTPNALADGDPAEPETLPAYHRLDLGLRYRRALAGVAVEAAASFFNVYARDNTWYRSPLLVQPQRPTGATSVTVDVYDLGFQPSFSLGLRF